METKETNFQGFKMNGFLALFLHLIVFTGIIVLGFLTLSIPVMILSGCLSILWFILMAGYVQLEPNEARVMVFFGTYKGTFRETGFYFFNNAYAFSPAPQNRGAPAPRGTPRSRPRDLPR